MAGYLEKAVGIGKVLRENNINTQIYLEKAKMGKKFGFADKLNIPYALIIGEEEVKQSKYTLRNMGTGDQTMFSIDEILSRLNN
ncbi:hypothetical protein CULT_1660005 [[Clostridium] ultunense Esp]|nr:hypothetical protein CULT_1660005 [[Clostridium] ultunense Esp]